MLLLLLLQQVLALALPAAGAAVAINSHLLPHWLLSQAASAAAAATTTEGQTQELASLHLCQEGVLALLLTVACRAALGPRVTAVRPSSAWLLQTAGTCLVLFPLVDPLLAHAWAPVAQV